MGCRRFWGSAVAEHYTRNTESVTKWCGICQRFTTHPVSGNRAGRCSEHNAPELSKAQQRQKEKREAESLRLFD
jgi:ribosomal protein L44E